MEWASWDELLDSGELVGYDGCWFDPIDYEVATGTRCEKCGGLCEWEGRTNGNGSRRGFSVCQKCGRVIEF